MPLLPDATGFAYKKVDKQSGSHLCVFHLIFIVLHYRQQKDFDRSGGARSARADPAVVFVRPFILIPAGFAWNYLAMPEPFLHILASDGAVKAWSLLIEPLPRGHVCPSPRSSRFVLHGMLVADNVKFA